MSDLPATMRAAWIEAPGAMTLREVPLPRPRAGEMLVRVQAALTCGTDVKTLQRGHARLPMPAPFGHEFAGVVAAVGAGVRGFREGDAVMCAPTAPCGQCGLCHRGRDNLCPHAIGRMVLGAYADYVLLPGHIVERHLFARRGLSAIEAALLEPLACVMQGMQRLAGVQADNVVVLGDGPIALLFAAQLAAMPRSRVLVVGRHPLRLEVASVYGAEVASARDDDLAMEAVQHFAPGGADVVIECVGTPAAWRLASTLAATGGTVMLFGGCAPSAEATFDATRLHYDEVTVVSSFHYGTEAVHEAAQVLMRRAFNAEALVTLTLPLERLPEALALMSSRRAVKVAVLP